MTRRIKDNLNARFGSVKDATTMTAKHHDHEDLPQTYTLSEQKQSDITRPELYELTKTNDEMKRQLNLLPDSVDKRLISEEVNSLGEHIDRELKDFEDKERRQGSGSSIEQFYGPRVAALMILCLVFVVSSTDQFRLGEPWMLCLPWLCVLGSGFLLADMLGRMMRQ